MSEVARVIPVRELVQSLFVVVTLVVVREGRRRATKERVRRSSRSSSLSLLCSIRRERK